MKYLLHNQIVFDSDASTLSPEESDEDQVQISNPAKRLFILLIAHQGETVSRETIFKKVWDDFGMVSSNNNLNQCISKLRRVIRNLGIEEEVITTVPRLGFMLQSHIVVESLPEDMPFSGLDAGQLTVTGEGDTSEERAPQEETAAFTPAAANNGRLHFFRICFSGWKAKAALLILISAIVLVLALKGHRPADKNIEVYVGIAGGCKLLMSQNSLNGANEALLKTGILNYARRLDLTCGSNEYILVFKSASQQTWISDLSRLYFMRCGYLRESKAEICWGLNDPTHVRRARTQERTDGENQPTISGQAPPQNQH